MKSISFGLLLMMTINATAQSLSVDTPASVSPKHVTLEDIVVIDDRTEDQNLCHTIDNHQVELQLKQLQGVNLISRGSFAQEVVYRGQSDGRIQVKLNGMRIYNACTDRMDPSTSYVVSTNLSTVDAASSTESHCHNNGLAGSVNLTTKEPVFDNTKSWKLGLSQQYLSNTHGINSSFQFEQNFSKFAYRLSGTWLKNENYTDGNGNTIRYSQNQKQNWAFNAVYKIQPTQLIKVDFIYDLAQQVGYPALPMDVSVARGIIGGISYENYAGFGPFGQFELKAYHNDIYHEMDDTHRENVFMHMDMPGWSQTSGVTFDASRWDFASHSITMAAEYYTNYRRAEMTMYPDNGSEPPMFMLTWPDARVHGTALGLSDKWQRNKHTLFATLRIDYESSHVVDEFGRNQWTGMGYNMTTSQGFALPQIKMGWQYQLTSNTQWNLSMSYGKRGPTTSELYGFYLYNAHDGFDYLGNPYLNPEELFNPEMGLTYTGEKLQISGKSFLQLYQNYIFGLTTNYSSMTYGANGVREFHNIPKATFYGFEGRATYAFNTKLSSRVKLDYLRGFRPEADLPLVPPLQGVFGVDYTRKALSVMMQVKMANEQKHFNNEYGDRYTPGYTLLDAGVSYKFEIKNIHTALSIAVNNLLNTYYRDHLNWGGIPSMGRNIIINLSINL